MVDFTLVKIGSKLNYKNRYKKDNDFVPCEVVHIFKAYKLPKTKDVLKYYGNDIVDPKYGRVFGPMKIDRIVLKRNNDDYIVIHADINTFRWIDLSVISYEGDQND